MPPPLRPAPSAVRLPQWKRCLLFLESNRPSLQFSPLLPPHSSTFLLFLWVSTTISTDFFGSGFKDSVLFQSLGEGKKNKTKHKPALNLVIHFHLLPCLSPLVLSQDLEKSSLLMVQTPEPQPFQLAPAAVSAPPKPAAFTPRATSLQRHLAATPQPLPSPLSPSRKLTLRSRPGS